jgi:hypothetical protein
MARAFKLVHKEGMEVINNGWEKGEVSEWNKIYPSIKEWRRKIGKEEWKEEYRKLEENGIDNLMTIIKEERIMMWREAKKTFKIKNMNKKEWNQIKKI